MNVTHNFVAHGPGKLPYYTSPGPVMLHVYFYRVRPISFLFLLVYFLLKQLWYPHFDWLIYI